MAVGMGASRVGHLGRSHEIAQPQLEGVHAQPVRGDVDHALTDEIGLVAAGRSVRAPGRLVRDHLAHLAAVCRPAVRPRKQRRCHARHDETVRADIGARVVQEAIAQRQETPLRVERQRDVVHLLPGVVARAQMLLAVLAPRHGPAQPDRAERNQEVLRIELAAGAEAAAHVQLDEADALLGPVQQARENAAVDRVMLRKQAARLERDGRVPPALDPLFDDELRPLERGVDVAPLDREGSRAVGARRLVEQRRAVRHGLVR
jgi:hypothetical protein